VYRVKRLLVRLMSRLALAEKYNVWNDELNAAVCDKAWLSWNPAEPNIVQKRLIGWVAEN
jgi:hypothetical protein